MGQVRHQVSSGVGQDLRGGELHVVSGGQEGGRLWGRQGIVGAGLGREGSAARSGGQGGMIVLVVVGRGVGRRLEGEVLLGCMGVEG